MANERINGLKKNSQNGVKEKINAWEIKLNWKSIE